MKKCINFVECSLAISQNYNEIFIELRCLVCIEIIFVSVLTVIIYFKFIGLVHSEICKETKLDQH